MSKNSTSLIISDLHLIDGQSPLFKHFCRNYAAKYDRLIILGDLFNIWLGDDASILTYDEVISELHNLTKTTEVLVLHGNRDFLLGKDFAAKSGCKIISEPYFLTHDQQKYVLIHGDSLCTDDVNYQRFKRIIRHPLIKFIILSLPQKLRVKLGSYLRQKSQKANQTKPAEITDINQTSTDNFMQNHPNTHLIHGHTHRQNTHKTSTYTRYVLGDWSKNIGNAISLTQKLNRLEINQ